VRDSAVHARTKAINELKSILVTADPALRESLRGFGTKALVRRCASVTGSADLGLVEQSTVYAMRVLGQRILALTAEADDTEKRMTDLLNGYAPNLISRTGIGPDSAAALLIVAGDNHDRITAEASFAALCGVTPVEASSGNTQRRRLNRGGDRRANAALYRIVLSRLRWDRRTQAYMSRRLAEGKTRREVMRCLKRYVAREVFPLISHPTAASATTNPRAA
jgi:transposase